MPCFLESLEVRKKGVISQLCQSQGLLLPCLLLVRAAPPLLHSQPPEDTEGQSMEGPGRKGRGLPCPWRPRAYLQGLTSSLPHRSQSGPPSWLDSAASPVLRVSPSTPSTRPCLEALVPGGGGLPAPLGQFGDGVKQEAPERLTHTAPARASLRRVLPGVSLRPLWSPGSKQKPAGGIVGQSPRDSRPPRTEHPSRVSVCSVVGTQDPLLGHPPRGGDRQRGRSSAPLPKTRHPPHPWTQGGTREPPPQPSVSNTPETLAGLPAPPAYLVHWGQT